MHPTNSRLHLHPHRRHGLCDSSFRDFICTVYTRDRFHQECLKIPNLGYETDESITYSTDGVSCAGLQAVAEGGVTDSGDWVGRVESVPKLPIFHFLRSDGFSADSFRYG